MTSSQTLQRGNMAAASTFSLALFIDNSSLRLSLDGMAENIASSRSLDFSASALKACINVARCKRVLYQHPSLHLQSVLHHSTTKFHRVSVCVCFFPTRRAWCDGCVACSRFYEDSPLLVMSVHSFLTLDSGTPNSQTSRSENDT